MNLRGPDRQLGLTEKTLQIPGSLYPEQEGVRISCFAIANAAVLFRSRTDCMLQDPIKSDTLAFHGRRRRNETVENEERTGTGHW